MDKMLIISVIIYILSIAFVGAIQYLIGYKHGYKEAKIFCKQELDKVIDKWSSECTITSTED